MGVFRIKENVDDFFEKDPFELFALDAPEPQGKARKKAGFWSSVGLGILLAVVVSGVAFYALTREKRTDHETPFAYFEVRVIGPEGRPIAGAVIREGRKYLGVTDSFGEWRRFMRVKLGSSVLLDVRKESSSGVLVASKSLAIPLSHAKSGDLEIKGSVQLETGDGDRSHDKKVVGIKSASESGTPDGGTLVSKLPSPPVSGGINPPSSLAADAQTAANPVTGSAAAAAAGAEVDQGSIWFEADGQSGATQALIQALRQRASELGLKVSEGSPWRLRLTDIDAQGARLLRVESIGGAPGNGRPLARFIRVSQESPNHTARDILWATSIHTVKGYQVSRAGDMWRIVPPGESLWALAPGKVLVDALGRIHPVYAAPGGGGLMLSASQGDPCQGSQSCTVTSPGVKSFPPVSGWQLLSMRVKAAFGEQIQVYVSGYEAHATDKNQYEYWGAPEGTANVTVLRGGKAVYRGRIEARPGAIPTVIVPSLPVAQLAKP